MSIRIVAALICVLVLMASDVRADSLAEPREHTVTSRNGKFALLLTPTDGEWGKGSGIVSEVNGRELYAVDWFARSADLSDDGRLIVRHGPWASDSRGLTDFAIAFYNEGQLIRRYEVRDLLNDPSKIDRSASHYDWRARVQSRPDGFTDEGRYRLTTIDRTQHTFNPLAGTLVEADYDPAARSWSELDDEQDRERLAAGLKITNRLAAETDLFKHFNVSESTASSGRPLGVNVPCPCWSGVLRRVKPLKLNVDFQVSLLLDADDPLASLGTLPERFLRLAEQVDASDWFVDRVETGDVTGIRLRAAHGRLIWSEDALSKAWVTAEQEPDELQLSDWGEFILDLQGEEKKRTRTMQCVWFNVESEALLIETPDGYRLIN